MTFRTQRLGSTQLDMQSFRDYLEGIGKTQFAGNKYDLFTHNCNNFSHEVSCASTHYLVSILVVTVIINIPLHFDGLDF